MPLFLLLCVLFGLGTSDTEPAGQDFSRTECEDLGVAESGAENLARVYSMQGCLQESVGHSGTLPTYSTHKYSSCTCCIDRYYKFSSIAIRSCDVTLYKYFSCVFF